MRRFLLHLPERRELFPVLTGNKTGFLWLVNMKQSNCLIHSTWQRHQRTKANCRHEFSEHHQESTQSFSDNVSNLRTIINAYIKAEIQVNVKDMPCHQEEISCSNREKFCSQVIECFFTFRLQFN